MNSWLSALVGFQPFLVGQTDDAAFELPLVGSAMPMMSPLPFQPQLSIFAVVARRGSPICIDAGLHSSESAVLGKTVTHEIEDVRHDFGASLANVSISMAPLAVSSDHSDSGAAAAGFGACADEMAVPTSRETTATPRAKRG